MNHNMKVQQYNGVLNIDSRIDGFSFLTDKRQDHENSKASRICKSFPNRDLGKGSAMPCCMMVKLHREPRPQGHRRHMGLRHILNDLDDIL